MLGHACSEGPACRKGPACCEGPANCEGPARCEGPSCCEGPGCWEGPGCCEGPSCCEGPGCCEGPTSSEGGDETLALAAVLAVFSLAPFSLALFFLVAASSAAMRASACVSLRMQLSTNGALSKTCKAHRRAICLPAGKAEVLCSGGEDDRARRADRMAAWLPACEASSSSASAAALCTLASFGAPSNATKAGMAPAQTTFPRPSVFPATFCRVLVACSCASAELCAPNNATKGEMAPAVVASTWFLEVMVRLRRAPAAASCTASRH